MHRWRSPIAIKSVVAVALIASGFCAVKRSVAIAVARADPVMALGMSSGDARIMADASQVLMERATTDGQRREAASLALDAFRRDGTQVSAVTTLGFFRGLVGNDRLGADWFAYSTKLSRRDFRTQLYFIEKSAADGDVVATLSHYDTALRASDSAPTILFPILRNAIVNTPVRTELVKTLAQRPLWAERFLTDAAAYGPDFVAVTQLLVEARRLGTAVSPTDDALLLNNLVLNNQIPLAWRYFVGFHPAAKNSLLRNGKFAATGVIETPFDWQLLPGTGVTAGLGAGEGDQILDYQLASTVSAPVIRQMTVLPAGTYRLTSGLVASSQNRGQGPYWELKCIDGRVTGTLEMGGPIEGVRSFSTDLIVPSGCDAQLLTLVVRSSDDQAATGQIGFVSLSRVK